MRVEVVHHVPGRLRLRIPATRECDGLCEWIKAPLLTQPGVRAVRVNTWCASLVVTYDRATPRVVERLLAALEFFTVPDASAAATEVDEPLSLIRTIKRIVRAGLEFLGRSHNLLWGSIALAGSLLGNVFALATSPLICVTAAPSLVRAWQVLAREHRLNVDFLDSLSILVSLARAQFVTASFITWMIALSDWIRDKTARRSKRLVRRLLEYETATAWVIRDGKIVRLKAAEITAGETVIVYPGEIIPVDGIVVSGNATVDQKTITGESLPVERGTDDTVFASTVLRDGKLSVRATRVGNETTAAQIVTMVDSAPLGETRAQNYAEQLGDRLVAPMLGVSAGLFAMSGNLDRLLSMLIIDFGTGIRVAAPTAVLSAIAHAANKGILIKGGRQLENLARVDTIVFDKTGTLTHGSPEIRDIVSCDERAFPPREILALAAAAEARLKHPVSEALVSKALAEGIDIPERIETDFKIGLGVKARVNGYYVHVGSARFFDEQRINLNGHAAGNGHMSRNGCSTLLVAIDGELKGVIPYADRIRAESKNVISFLHHAGIENVAMITGDNRTTAEAVARQLGIDQCFAETLPSDKAEIVRELQGRGRVVAMVGDGINDSPALAFADVGIAMKHGADVAKETADIVLMEDNLSKLMLAVEVARGTMSRIKQNFSIIATLNAIALLLSIPQGVLSPNLAATISNGSAVLASLNSIRSPLSI